MSEGNTKALESSKKLFKILEYLIESGGAGVTEIANATSLAKSTVHLHLQSLTETGQVVKRDGEYQPSLQLFEWGERIRNGIEAYRKGRKEIDTLAEETNELVNLGVVENNIVRLVHLRHVSEPQTNSSSSISTEFQADAPRISVLSNDYRHTLGRELHMHATAMGKAMLAELPHEEVETVIDQHGLPAYTENTITSPEELFAELETIRSKGFAVDKEERAQGLSCVAASICRDGEPEAAVSISGPTNRLTGGYRENLARDVVNTANVIEVKLTYS